LRSLSVTFKDEILEFYDLKLAKIVDVIQTKVPLIEVKDRDMDINFILADNTIAHLEFESSEPTLDDQIRYGHYDLELYKQRRQKIHRIVIYGAGIKQAPEPLDIGSIRQTQSVIYLEKDFDGDQVFLELKDRILRGEPLRNLDKMKIILLPMMSSKISSRSRRALEMTEVLENYPEKDMGYYLIGAMVGTNYSLLQEPEKSKILEVLRMAQPFQELYREFEEKGMRKGMRKGMEKGRTEGKQESICKLLAKKFGPESTELQERVRKITDETALDRFIEELIVADNINDAAKVIEALN
jgi:predicted transposase YdaD